MPGRLGGGVHTVACADDDSQRTRTVAEAGASLSHAHEAPVLLAHVVDHTAQLVEGRLVPALLRLTRERPRGAVFVLRTRGSGAVGEMLLGSVFAGVVCAAGRPVVLAGPCA